MQAVDSACAFFVSGLVPPEPHPASRNAMLIVINREAEYANFIGSDLLNPKVMQSDIKKRRVTPSSFII
jgi:hypothetical protein